MFNSESDVKITTDFMVYSVIRVIVLKHLHFKIHGSEGDI